MIRKTVIIFIVILVAVYITLGLICRDREYLAEKAFYRALRANKELVVNPDVAPPNLVASVERDLKVVFNKFPDTETAKAARIALAEFYVFRKERDAAIDTLNGIISKGYDDVGLLSRAHFMKGSIYEAQDKWEEALNEYRILRDSYYNTLVGLETPIHIGLHYTKTGERGKAEEAYHNAAGFYEKIEKANRDKMLGYAAACLLRESYINLNEYEKAAGVVEDMLKNYESDITFTQQLPFIEFLWLKKLNRPQAAMKVYKDVKNKTQNKKLQDMIDEKIKQLESQDRPPR